MGFWGEGMRDNDTALDEVGNITDWDFNTNIYTLKDGIDIDAVISDIVKENFDADIKILGIADFCLEKKLELSKQSWEYVRNAVTREMSYRKLEAWADSMKRLKSLEDFSNRIGGDN